ncbi:MAG: 23S rRNA (uracil-5-)-methyltransferase RumA, partial [Candidatus Limosilactobacillus intestinavium]
MTQRKHHPSFHHSKRHTQSPIEVNIGDRFPLTIKKLGVEGQGIGYFKHKVCF